MLLACPQCGSANPDSTKICPSCQHPIAAPLDPQTAWREELAARLAAYRSRRRGRVGKEEGQESLPFQPGPNGDGNGTAKFASTERNIFIPPPRPVRITIRDDQPRLAFPEFSAGEGISAHARVAAMRLRLRAGFLDAAFLGLAFLVFLAMFHFLGGRLMVAKTEIAVLGASAYLLYAQYFFLFVGFGGATPGMRWAGLDIANFAGEPATSRQLLWRGFGYLVSGGSLFLGFLWVFVDEERLTWHDRISQTILAVHPESSTEES